MNKAIELQKKYVAIGVIAFAAICILLWQPKPMALPATLPLTNNETHNPSPQTTSLEQFTAFFDLSLLPTEPAPVVKQPVIAPDATIQRYRLLGVTLNSRDAIALVSDGTNSTNLKLGDSFKGFIVSAIEARRIEFTANETVSTLTLPL